MMDPLRVLRGKWKEIALVGLLFSIATLISLYMYMGKPFAKYMIKTSLELNPIMQAILRLIKRGYYYPAIQLIFLNNFVLVALGYLSAPGLIPGLNVIILLIQAHSLGLYLAGSGVLENTYSLLRIIPVLVLECTSYIIVTAAALDVGLCLIKPSIVLSDEIDRKKAVLMMLSDLGRAYIVVIPLLYLASVVEVLMMIYT